MECNKYFRLWYQENIPFGNSGNSGGIYFKYAYNVDMEKTNYISNEKGNIKNRLHWRIDSNLSVHMKTLSLKDKS